MTEHPMDVPLLRVSYRRLVLWFGCQLLSNIGAIAVQALGPPALAPIVVGANGLITLATVVALAYYGFRTAQALSSPVPWLWALVMFVPCVNAISLLALSSKANQACAAHGIPVGLMGPK